MNRRENLYFLIAYLLTIPAGAFFYLTRRDMGYSTSSAGIIAAVLALAGLALIPFVVRSDAAGPTEPEELVPAKTSWAVLIGFVLLMVGVLAYFALKDN